MPAFIIQQQTALFTREREAAVSCLIWMSFLRWAVEFLELVCGIWQNFPQKTVDPSTDCDVSIAIVRMWVRLVAILLSGNISVQVVHMCQVG